MSYKILKKTKSRNELANDLGISPIAVSRWFTGKSSPSYDNLKATALLCDCTIDSIVNKIENMRTYYQKNNTLPSGFMVNDDIIY